MTATPADQHDTSGMIRLCDAAMIAPGHPVIARLSQACSVILLRQPDGAIMAWRNACPHMGIELDWEPHRLLTRDGRYLRCSGHDARFDPATGQCVRGPCQGESLTPLRVRLQDGAVLLDE